MTKIKDIELLNKNNQDILELEKKIQELPEIKELNKLKKEEKQIKNKINKYSIYDSILIGNIIAKLMTIFEGIEYYCKKNNTCFLDCNYNITPKLNNLDNTYIYPNYKIKNIKQERLVRNKKELCYLPLSSFKSKPQKQSKNIEYIQLFIDYLYEKRTEKSLEEINNIELEEILKEFIEITNNLQQQRKIEIEEKINDRIIKQKRKEFEDSCIIDRKLIFNSIVYIINNYESNMLAKKQTDQKWSYKEQWSELLGYHKLIIEYNNKQIIYSTIIDKIGCYPDEEYCYRGFHINMDKDTTIPFFDIKYTLLPVINKSNYLKEFINMIENLYNEEKNITPDNIEEFLIILSNKKKGKEKTLKKNINII